MGKRKLVPLLCLSSWRLVIVVWLFLMMPGVCLQFVIVVFPDQIHLLFLSNVKNIFADNSRAKPTTFTTDEYHFL